MTTFLQCKFSAPKNCQTLLLNVESPLETVLGDVNVSNKTPEYLISYTELLFQYITWSHKYFTPTTFQNDPASINSGETLPFRQRDESSVMPRERTWNIEWCYRSEADTRGRGERTMHLMHTRVALSTDKRAMAICARRQNRKQLGYASCERLRPFLRRVAFCRYRSGWCDYASMREWVTSFIGCTG